MHVFTNAEVKQGRNEDVERMWKTWTNGNFLEMENPDARSHKRVAPFDLGPRSRFWQYADRTERYKKCDRSIKDYVRNIVCKRSWMQFLCMSGRVPHFLRNVTLSRLCMRVHTFLEIADKDRLLKNPRWNLFSLLRREIRDSVFPDCLGN